MLAISKSRDLDRLDLNRIDLQCQLSSDTGPPSCIIWKKKKKKKKKEDDKEEEEENDDDRELLYLRGPAK